MATQYVDKLKQQMPPPANPPLNEVNWSIAEEVVGLRYPADFKEFIQAYGNAIWCDSFRPIYPGSTREECEEYLTHINELLGYMDYLYDEKGPLAYKLYPTPGGLLPCLTAINGGCFCWITEGDPDQWDVLDWDRGPCTVFKNYGVTKLISDWIAQAPPVKDVWNQYYLEPDKFKLMW